MKVYEDEKLTKEYLDTFTYQLAKPRNIETKIDSDINLSVDFGKGNRVEVIRVNSLNQFSMTIRLNRGRIFLFRTINKK